MGKPVRRLRPLLPEQARGRGHRQIFFTDVGCRLLDAEACRCRDYANRIAQVEDCVRLTPENVREIRWLPPTCGYSLLAEGRDLIGGIRWYRAIRKACMPPASRCAGGCDSPRSKSPTASWRITSSNGRAGCRRGGGEDETTAAILRQ